MDIYRTENIHQHSPHSPDPFACAELQCPALDTETLFYCETKRHCGFAYQRRREESAIDQARKDDKRKMRDHA